jgi:hypothetical protein
VFEANSKFNFGCTLLICGCAPHLMVDSLNAYDQ